MKLRTVAGTNDSITTIATNDMVQEHVTNFTKELFGYIANGIGDDISSIARTMLGEVVEKIDDWQIGKRIDHNDKNRSIKQEQKQTQIPMTQNFIYHRNESFRKI